MTADEIKEALATRAEDFARWLFPAGRLNGSEWQIGSVDGEPGKSLSIRVNGAKVGVFKDFATDNGGDNLVELYAQAKSVPFKEALRACADWSGVVVSPTGNQRTNWSAPVRHAKVKPKRIDVMPDVVASAWNEGVDYILAHPDKAEQLASFRGWPVEFAQYVVGCGVISLPLRYNEREIAFQVVVPEGEPGSMVTRPIGYHVRVKGKMGTGASWLYQPSAGEHGQGIPPLPFILGDFEAATLLVVLEGQWDAITFALAAGWLGEGRLWPAKVGLIGIRGAHGWKTFLEYYERFWPERPNCLLIPDADDAGRKWYGSEDCFATRLSKFCRKVAVVDCGPHKDFNDLYRAEQPGPQVIGELLASHGMNVESELTV
ncbi:MAG: hypothetical protein ABIR38_01840 [Chthoniobacterales bacterium]